MLSPPRLSPLLLAALLAPVLLVLVSYGGRLMSSSAEDAALKGYNITMTTLRPKYVEGCSRLTSLYASWKDVDGSGRDEPHSGVDGGRLGDPIYAPGPGVVRAVWVADWGWGAEGALLILHPADEINMDEGVDSYYSAFYHLDYQELKGIKLGQRIERGELLAHVFRPGGNARYLPEVHWEVYEVRRDEATRWHVNSRQKAYWTNSTAKLIDPLYMLSREPGTLEGTSVTIMPYTQNRSYEDYRGFTYILPCDPEVERRRSLRPRARKAG